MLSGKTIAPVTVTGFAIVSLPGVVDGVAEGVGVSCALDVAGTAIAATIASIVKTPPRQIAPRRSIIGSSLQGVAQ
jgi:hypothetical protein